MWIKGHIYGQISQIYTNYTKTLHGDDILDKAYPFLEQYVFDVLQ